ncbi:glycosyltransferase [Granulicella cerasi]|uniref:Glycosyltransferase n=1 Tax=Granulicella cerasi TaxID=741063 RepID=A0ABW1Z6F3_9BACT|nr:glycosyltransferase [Granulicella cerasi]
MLVLALLALAAWLYLATLHGRFWQSGPTLPEAQDATASIAVIVPARNEAESIAHSLGSLLAQQYSGALSIILVDDNSTDGTAAIAAALPHAERLTIISGQPLPAGWSGKLWAVHQGLQHPLAQAAEFVLLTDADILHAPTHLATLVHRAQTHGDDLVSEMVRLHCDSAAERAYIPAFIFFFQMLYPFAQVNDARSRTAGAAGGTMLIRRSALDRIDGVERIRQNLIDDCALARELKQSGARLWLGHAELADSLRIYADRREIWNMIARTAYVQLNHWLPTLAGCIAGMTLLYLAPPALTLFAHGLTRLIALITWLLMAALFQPTLRRYRRSPLWGLALPGIASFYLAATIASAYRHHAGRGGGWKDRTYPA